MPKKDFIELLKKERTPFDKESLKLLSKLIYQVDGNVVLVVTSTWRLSDNAMKILIHKINNVIQNYNVIITKTSNKYNGIKGLQIHNYFKDHRLDSNIKYVIIDSDESNILDIPDYDYHFVKCNYETGFKQAEYKRALKILGGKKVEPYKRNI